MLRLKNLFAKKKDGEHGSKKGNSIGKKTFGVALEQSNPTVPYLIAKTIDQLRLRGTLGSELIFFHLYHYCTYSVLQRCKQKVYSVYQVIIRKYMKSGTNLMMVCISLLLTMKSLTGLKVLMLTSPKQIFTQFVAY